MSFDNDQHIFCFRAKSFSLGSGPQLFGTRTGLMEDNFSMDRRWWVDSSGGNSRDKENWEQQMKLQLLTCHSSALQAGSQQDRELGTPVLKDSILTLKNHLKSTS